ncbi:MAG: hypothetical protein EBT95_00050 [Verrucomicrobia bacterium]|nr:hypothetical protein [Verrucomicrobiota bacterium]
MFGTLLLVTGTTSEQFKDLRVRQERLAQLALLVLREFKVQPVLKEMSVQPVLKEMSVQPVLKDQQVRLALLQLYLDLLVQWDLQVLLVHKVLKEIQDLLVQLVQ